MAAQRRAGLIQVQINGEVHDAKGNWTYNLGRPRRESMMGADGFHGYTERPQPAFIEGEITDRGDLDLGALASIVNATVTISLANGKVIVLRDAFFAGEGTGATDEANVAVRFEGASADEVS